MLGALMHTAPLDVDNDPVALGLLVNVGGVAVAVDREEELAFRHMVDLHLLVGATPVHLVGGGAGLSGGQAVLLVEPDVKLLGQGDEGVDGGLWQGRHHQKGRGAGDG